MLKPHQERLACAPSRWTGDTIAVNGERVSPGVLAPGWARTAEAILRLQPSPTQRAGALRLPSLVEAPEEAPRR